MEASFTLKKREDFTFALENEPDVIYTLPALKGFSFEEAQEMSKIDDEENLVKKGAMIRAFILRYAPQLEEKDLSDMEYLEIFNAFAMSEGRKELGESKASQTSLKNTARR